MNGILNIQKEAGYTSHDVVAKLRGILRQKKIGHTGTLDPQATGVLPVCLGKATKLCDVIGDWDKVYRAKLLLGVTTDTEDIFGQITEEKDLSLCSVSEEEIREAVLSFVGDYEQIPPMYSAKKVRGKKLYEFARNGIEIERKPAKVKIYEISILSIEFPYVTFDVHCAKGTYIRSLCRDIGHKLKTGGCMASLVRLGVSDFLLEDALTLAEVETAVDAGTLPKYIRPIDSVFLKHPKVTVKEEAQKLLQNGNPLPFGVCRVETKAPLDSETPGNLFRVYNSKNQFIGLYQPDRKTQRIKPYKLFFDEEITTNEIHSQH